MANSNLKLAMTVKMEMMLTINPNPPNCSGVYSLDKKGEATTVSTWAIVVPTNNIDTFTKKGLLTEILLYSFVNKVKFIHSPTLP